MWWVKAFEFHYSVNYCTETVHQKHKALTSIFDMQATVLLVLSKSLADLPLWYSAFPHKLENYIQLLSANSAMVSVRR